jgi:hypothetical protein
MKMNYFNLIFAAIFFVCFSAGTVLACNSYSYHNNSCQPNTFVSAPHSASCVAADTTDKCFPKYLARAGRVWLDIGPNLVDPWLDPLLMSHSFYADRRIRCGQGQFTFPSAGLSGTDSLQITILNIPGGDHCGTESKSFIQDIGQSSTVNVGPQGKLQWSTLSGNQYGSGTTPYGSGQIDRVPVVYTVKPRFPDIRHDSFWVNAEPQISMGAGTTRTLAKNQAHIIERIIMQHNSVLNIEVGGKGERTIVYLRDGIIRGDGAGSANIYIRSVDSNGNPIPEGDCDSQYGQALIISRGCIQTTLAADAAIFETSVSFITLGALNVTGGSRITGQIIADVVTTNGGMAANDAIRGMTFRPTKTYQLDVPPVTFGEDKFWAWRTSGCDFNNAPKYYNAITSGVGTGSEITKEQAKALNGNKIFYDTLIRVAPSESIEDNGHIKIKWKIELSDAVQPLQNSPIESQINDRTRMIVIGGNIEGGYITGTMTFTKNNPGENIALYIIDREKGVDETFVLSYELVEVTGDNRLSSNLMPTTITVKSDNDCSDIPPPPPPPVKPSIKWSAIFDIDGDGYPDVIRAEIENIQELGITDEFSFKWGSKSGNIKGNPTIPSNVFEFDIKSFNSLDGADDNGWLSLNNGKQVKIIDSCGPAIKSGNAKFRYSNGENGQFDTLVLEFTEAVKDPYPFIGLFFKKQQNSSDLTLVSTVKTEQQGNKWIFLYDAGDITSNGNLTYFWVKMYSAEIVCDEYGKMCPHTLTDLQGNLPLDNNIWVKIDEGEPPVKINYIDFTINSAEFYSNSNPADGYVDSIKIYFDFNPGVYGSWLQFVPHIENLVKNGLKLPGNREFKINDLKIVGQNSIEIKVSQDRNKVSAKTITGESDKILINGEVLCQDIKDVGIRAINAISPTPKDFIAPIILKGRFVQMTVKDENDEKNVVDTLVIHFSESVLGQQIEPDMIKLKSNGAEYIDFEWVSEKDNIVVFSVKYDNGRNKNLLPQNGDSIRIEHGIKDERWNEQKTNTVWAELEVAHAPAAYDVIIYNPGIDDKNIVDNLFAGFSYENVVVCAKSFGNRKLDLSAKIAIFDKLGNKMVDTEVRSQNGVLIWSWNGKNSRGRKVGSGTYQMIIQITDNETGGSQTIQKKVGIKN